MFVPNLNSSRQITHEELWQIFPEEIATFSSSSGTMYFLTLRARRREALCCLADQRRYILRSMYEAARTHHIKGGSMRTLVIY